MTRRFFCEHGKVRMMIMEPDDKDGPEYRGLYIKDVASFACWATSMDRVDVEVARKSDMGCPECDAKRKKPMRER